MASSLAYTCWVWPSIVATSTSLPPTWAGVAAPSSPAHGEERVAQGVRIRALHAQRDDRVRGVDAEREPGADVGEGLALRREELVDLGLLLRLDRQALGHGLDLHRGAADLGREARGELGVLLDDHERRGRGDDQRGQAGEGERPQPLERGLRIDARGW